MDLDLPIPLSILRIGQDGQLGLILSWFSPQYKKQQFLLPAICYAGSFNHYIVSILCLQPGYENKGENILKPIQEEQDQLLKLMNAKSDVALKSTS